MCEYDPGPLGNDFNSIEELSTLVQARVDAGLIEEADFFPNEDSLGAFQILAELCVLLLEIAGIIALVGYGVLSAFGISSANAWGYVALAVAVVCIPSDLLLKKARKKAKIGRVVLARIVQCYNGGYVPYEEDDGRARGFTGICIFALGPAVSLELLSELAERAFEYKSQEDAGEFEPLKQMMLTGDNKFVKSSFELPEKWAGRSGVFLAPIGFSRKHLPKGYLSTEGFYIFVNEDDPAAVSYLHKEFWESEKSLYLLNELD